MTRIVKSIVSWIFTCYAKFTANNWKADIKANGFTKLTSKTTLGRNVNFNGMRVFGIGKCYIGDNFHSGFGCNIMTSYHNYEGDKIPYDKTLIVKGDTVIKDNVWFGINVTVMGGVTIGEGAIIQAGSVVINNIPDYAIAGGHPAKVFSNRNIEHYHELKKEGKFY